MRKQLLDPTALGMALPLREAWLDLEEIAQVQVTSEHPDYPIESAFRFGCGPGWRASGPGKQTIRLIFDHPQQLRRIWLRFLEAGTERTQEFSLRWSSDKESRKQEIVRQQWNFSPEGSTTEIEDYRVNLENVSLLELTITPDLSRGNAVATLADWSIA